MSRKYRRIRIATIILGIIAAAAFGLAVFGAVKEREMRLRLETEMNRVEQMLEEQKTMLAELQEETQEEVEVYLPQRLYVAVGRTLELYNSQVAFSGKDWEMVCKRR